jgi:hypothetical protein
MPVVTLFVNVKKNIFIVSHLNNTNFNAILLGWVNSDSQIALEAK